MFFGSSESGKNCSCGRVHEQQTKFAVVERGALKDYSKYISDAGLCGKCAAIYDENTYAATEGLHPAVDTEVVLPPDNLHANEHGVELAEKALKGDEKYLVAVGSGTVHDITRYIASKRKIPFVSCPTAASVDGFCSSIAAMTWNGAKVSFPAIPPVCVIADVDVVAAAPKFLAMSGFGDMIGKYISLADWKISHVLLNEYYCETISGITEKATADVLACADELGECSHNVIEKLTFGLVMSGIAMQLIGNSRPASGAEHHISHLIETAPMELGVYSEALHGEKVGVATLLCAREYHRMVNDPKAIFGDYPVITDEFLISTFGEAYGKEMIRENTGDIAVGLTAADFAAKKAEIKKIVDGIPTAEQLLSIYERAGVKSTLAEIGLDESKTDTLLDLSPYMRLRVTFMRLRRALVK